MNATVSMITYPSVERCRLSKAEISGEFPGVFQGSSELIFGQGGADNEGVGTKCLVKAGDVIVIPAGVSHASVTMEPITGKEDEPPYLYVGVYPRGAPQYTYDLGERVLETDDALFQEIAAVPIPPNDPIFGPGGPLTEIWQAARSKKLGRTSFIA
jgi:uncharacterized protein YjlB